jgi:hypothetical protein
MFLQTAMSDFVYQDFNETAGLTVSCFMYKLEGEIILLCSIMVMQAHRVALITHRNLMETNKVALNT